MSAAEAATGKVTFAKRSTRRALHSFTSPPSVAHRLCPGLPAPWTYSPYSAKSIATCRTRLIPFPCEFEDRFRSSLETSATLTEAGFGHRADALKGLSGSTEPATSLLLFSTVHHLLISLFSTLPTVDALPERLFTLFHNSVFSALGTQADSVEDKARLSDTLLDVIWQIDQEVDSGALEFRQAGGVYDMKKLQDLVTAGRKRLANFLRSLVVSHLSTSLPGDG